MQAVREVHEPQTKIEIAKPPAHNLPHGKKDRCKGRVIVALTVQEILDEHIAKKLA